LDALRALVELAKGRHTPDKETIHDFARGDPALSRGVVTRAPFHAVKTTRVSSPSRTCPQGTTRFRFGRRAWAPFPAPVTVSDTAVMTMTVEMAPK
jgi:hypothetical protein